MMKWEYHPLPVGFDRFDQDIEEALNNRGKDGWELLSVHEADFRVCVLKRTCYGN